MNNFNVKITFEENGEHAALLVFEAKRNKAGTSVDITLDANEKYALAAHLAKHLQEYLNVRIRNLAKHKTPDARA